MSRKRACCCCCPCWPNWSMTSKKPSVNHVTVVIFLEFFAWGLVATILPEAIQRFFGTDRMWLVLGMMQGVKGFLSFLAAPLVGTLSDIWGRKVFLLVTVASTCAPLAFLMMDNMWWHVVTSSLSGLFAVTYSIVFAYCSDVTDEDNRSAAFGQVSATFAASMVISPAVGSVVQSFYGNDTVFLMACTVSVMDVVYIFFFVPESLGVPLSERRKFQWSDVNPFSTLQMMFNTRLMTQLSTIVFFSYLPEAGQSQCFMLYLENTMRFSKADMSFFVALLGSLAIVAQTAVLSWLASRWSQKGVITCGLVFSILQLTVFGLVYVHWILYVNTALVAMGMITYPAVSAYVSNIASPEEQGAVQGMITGVRSLCNGLGPALFGVLFQLADTRIHEDQGGSRTGDFPGLPFLIGAVLVVFALGVNMSINPADSELPAGADRLSTSAKAKDAEFTPRKSEAAEAEPSTPTKTPNKTQSSKADKAKGIDIAGHVD